jgi:hypothetical protein
MAGFGFGNFVSGQCKQPKSTNLQSAGKEACCGAVLQL